MNFTQNVFSRKSFWSSWVCEIPWGKQHIQTKISHDLEGIISYKEFDIPYKSSEHQERIFVNVNIHRKDLGVKKTVH